MRFNAISAVFCGGVDGDDSQLCAGTTVSNRGRRWRLWRELYDGCRWLQVSLALGDTLEAEGGLAPVAGGFQAPGPDDKAVTYREAVCWLAEGVVGVVGLQWWRVWQASGCV